MVPHQTLRSALPCVRAPLHADPRTPFPREALPGIPHPCPGLAPPEPLGWAAQLLAQTRWGRSAFPGKTKNRLLPMGASAAPARAPREGDFGMEEFKSQCQRWRGQRWGHAKGLAPPLAAAPGVSRARWNPPCGDARSIPGPRCSLGFTPTLPKKELFLGPGVCSAASSGLAPLGTHEPGVSGCSVHPWQPARAATRPSSRCSSSAPPALVTTPWELRGSRVVGGQAGDAAGALRLLPGAP